MGGAIIEFWSILWFYGGVLVQIADGRCLNLVYVIIRDEV